MFDLETPIILAEDTDITRTIVRKMLEKMGFKKITEAVDGAKAWDEIERAVRLDAKYRLVIADWNMPQVNGLQLLQKMQANSSMRSIPFILLTSNTDKDQVVEAIRAGVGSFLAKPFPPSALERKLKEAWDLSQRRKAG